MAKETNTRSQSSQTLAYTYTQARERGRGSDRDYDRFGESCRLLVTLSRVLRNAHSCGVLRCANTKAANRRLFVRFSRDILKNVFLLFASFHFISRRISIFFRFDEISCDRKCCGTNPTDSLCGGAVCVACGGTAKGSPFLSPAKYKNKNFIQLNNFGCDCMRSVLSPERSARLIK